MENDKVAPRVAFASEQQDEKEKRDHTRSSRSIFIIYTFLCILIISSLYFIRTWQSEQNKESKTEPLQVLQSIVPSISFTPSKVISITPLHFFETNETKIARNLDLPPLYSGVTWEEMQGKPGDDFNEIWVYDDQIRVPITEGKWYRSQSPLKFFTIENYYWNELEQKGWVGVGGEEMYVKFNTFKLAGVFADNPCGGISGSLGYKDGLIRLFAIKREIKPCNPQGSQIASAANEENTYYTLFISETVTMDAIIKSLENYIANPT